MFLREEPYKLSIETEGYNGPCQLSKKHFLGEWTEVYWNISSGY